MPITVNKLENSHYEVLVDVDASEWKSQQEKAFKKLANNLQLPGFRKGKVPLAMAKAKIEQGAILNEALNEIVQPVFRNALEESKLVPMARPSYDVVKISDTELTLKFAIVVAPEVELGVYKDLTIGHNSVEVTEEEVTTKVNELTEKSAELVLKEDAAVLGDTVVLDFEGFVDGVAFEGGKAENHSLELGSGSFVPGFEEQVVGLKAGDVKDIVVTFPTNYVENLAGKEATFKITIHEVKGKVIPELNDALVAEQNIANVATVSDYKNHIKAELLNKKETDEKNAYIDRVLAKVRETSKVELAHEIIHDEAHNMEENLKNQLQQSGLNFEQYLAMTNQKEEDLHAKFHQDAEVNLANFLIIDAIAKKENIEVTKEVIDFEIAKIAEQYKMEEAKVREILAPNMERLANDIRQRQVFDLLLNQNA